MVLETINFPEPVVHVSIEPKTKADQEKLGVAMSRLAEEDPTFQVRTDDETGQTVISGMGELHLEVLVDRMRREFNVEAAVGRPQVAYRETVRGEATKVEGKFVRQTGGSGQYGIVYINLEPAPGEGFDFVNKIKGGSVPSEFIPAVEKGIEEALETGVKAGFPGRGRARDARGRQVPRHGLLGDRLQDRRLAGVEGGREARQAGAARADHGRGGRDSRGVHRHGHRRPLLPARPGQGQEPRGNAVAVRASVPLASMFGYATDLRSSTQGRANYTMQFDRYEEVPNNIAEEIVEHRTGEPVGAGA